QLLRGWEPGLDARPEAPEGATSRPVDHALRGSEHHGPGDYRHVRGTAKADSRQSPDGAAHRGDNDPDHSRQSDEPVEKRAHPLGGLDCDTESEQRPWQVVELATDDVRHHAL